MLTYNSMVPVVVHRALGKAAIEGSEEALKSLKRPVLIVHGEKIASLQSQWLFMATDFLRTHK
jgi:hypothetical protein